VDTKAKGPQNGTQQTQDNGKAPRRLRLMELEERIAPAINLNSSKSNYP